MKRILLPLALAGGLLAAIIAGLAQSKAARFEVDPSFPQLPAGKVLGDMSSVAVDSHDHVWMIHRPRTIPEAQRANAAPPVLEFDASGKFLAGWGGPGAGFEWPEREHGIYIDGVRRRLDQRQQRVRGSRHSAATRQIRRHAAEVYQ